MNVRRGVMFGADGGCSPGIEAPGVAARNTGREGLDSYQRYDEDGRALS
jgi:hypothetical protein